LFADTRYIQKFVLARELARQSPLSTTEWNLVFEVTTKPPWDLAAKSTESAKFFGSLGFRGVLAYGGAGLVPAQSRATTRVAPTCCVNSLNSKRTSFSPIFVFFVPFAVSSYQNVILW
jgi:hypothetical protein